MTTVEQSIKGFISAKLRCSFSGLSRIISDLIHKNLNYYIIKKNINLSAAFILCCTQLYAQLWAPQGAVWHYGYVPNGFDVQAFKTITAGSTVLYDNSIECQWMHENSFYNGSSITYHFLMYSENDSIFYYNVDVDDFCLLYDFSATTGSNIYLECFDMTVHIDSTSTRTINGTERRVQYVSTESQEYSFGGTIIEGIGDTVFMFPQLVNSPNGPLRCYEDNVGFVSFSDLSCDTVISTYSHNFDSNTGWQIFPNPAKNELYVELPEHCLHACCELVSIEGKLMGQYNISQNENKTSISAIPDGIYVLKLICNNQTFVQKIIIQH